MSPLTRKLALCAAVVLFGCSNELLNPLDRGGDGGTGGDDTASAGGEGGDDTVMLSLQTVAGEITWTVTFDDEAKALGATDCSYTRRYRGSQDDSRPWSCPSCSTRFRVDVDIVTGLEDCFAQVSSREPEAVEWIGVGDGPWWRGVGALMSEQGTATPADGQIHIVNQVTDVEAVVGGTLTFDVAGDLELGTEPGDPLNGFRPAETYACDWPKADPPAYDGDYTLALGGILPDGVFTDACNDMVRLHDLAGAYLVVDMAAIDCPPCRQMAALEEPFIAAMAAEGIEVRVVTLLAPSLADTLGDTTKAMLDGWLSSFALASPVLADRGWGLSLFSPAIGETTGYPSWAVVAPDLTVLDLGTGFSGWDVHGSVIRDHFATR